MPTARTHRILSVSKSVPVSHPTLDGSDKTVLLYDPHPSGHGHANYVTALANAYAYTAQKFHLDLLVNRRFGQLMRQGVTVHRLIQRPRGRRECSSTLSCAIERLYGLGMCEGRILWLLLKNKSIRIVHYQFTNGYASFVSCVCFRLLRRRRILTVHNVREHQTGGGLSAEFSDGLRRLLYRSFDALVVHSDTLKASLQEFLGMNHPPVYVQIHGCMETSRQECRRLADRLAAKRILFIGAPRPNKGLHVLLEAMSRLPEFELTIAGVREHESYFNTVLAPRIGQLRRDGHRIDVLKGFVPEEQLCSLMSTHSMVVLPYTSFSAQSGVLYLALGNDMPVVVSDVGALGETVRQFGVGIVVPPSDPAALADGIARLSEIEPTGLAHRLEEVRSKHSWGEAASQLGGVYEAVQAKA